MEDQLDEELKNRIKKVFDGFQDASADEGWLKLREKFPAEGGRRRMLPLFWWSAAALVLLALGLGVWKFSANNRQQNAVAVKNIKPAQPQNLQAKKPEPVKQGETLAHSTKIPAKAASAKPAQNAVAANRTQLLPVIPFNPPVVKPAASGADTAVKSSVLAIAAVNNKTVTGLAKTSQPANKGADSSNKPVNQASQNQIAIVQPKNKPAQTTGANSADQSNPAATLLADNRVNIKKVSDLGPRVRLGVYAASFVNYAKGSTNQTNAGAGFSAEIRIARNLKLVTGLTLAKNSLSYNGGVPSTAVQSNLLAPAAVGLASFSTAASFSSSAAVTVASVPAFQNYGVSMFNIDVPLNLKYDFNIHKTNFYLMAGLSSGTFASETYTYSYNYPALLSPSLQAPHSLSSQKSFDNFYFGKMLNVAFGYGYPIGRNHIILEPFLKYPLGGVGAQNIRLGTGGINLKLNFPTR